MSSACAMRPIVLRSRTQVALPVRRIAVVARAEGDSKVTREYNEADDTMSVKGQKPIAEVDANGNMYIDQLEAPKDNMSKEQKAKLLNEYVGFGGAPNKPLQTNWFLVISLVIAGLAIFSQVTGTIDFSGQPGSPFSER